MVPRILTFLVAVALAAFGLGAMALAGDRDGRDAVLARNEDASGVLATEDGDDPDGDTDDSDTGDGGGTSGVSSGDGTNSRHTAVSRDTDLSRGDLTRDRTKDGPGTSTRDRSSNQTNDGTKNDTR